MLVRSARRVLWALASCGALLLATSADANPPVYIIDTPNPQGGAVFGVAVATADVDGDGAADIAVGAPDEDVAPDTDRGRAYLFSGLSGGLLCTLTSPSPTDMAYFGTSIAMADVTGDGRAEIAVGAPQENGLAGRVYVFSYDGAACAPKHSLDNPDPTGSQMFGESLAAGNVDGDPVAELVVGAPGATSVEQHKGRVYVFDVSGPTPVLISSIASPMDQAGDRFGMGLAISDVTGDGAAELVAGAHKENVGSVTDQGAAYLFGLGGGDPTQLCRMDSPGGQVLGAFGVALALGNITGTPASAAEIAVGASEEDVGGTTDQGRVYVFNYDADDVVDGQCDLVSGACGVIDIPEPLGRALFGRDLAFGNMDEDLQAELVAAAPDWPSGTRRGRVYLFDDTACAPLKTFTSHVEQADANFGQALAAGDMNADGYSDPLVGSPREDVASNVNQGRVYAFCLSETHADQDGYSDCTEWHVGTDRVVRCGFGVLPQPSMAWPADFASGGIPDSTDRLNILDITSFLAPVRHFGTSPGELGYNVRWDITPGRGLFLTDINIQDLTSMLAGTSGFPPMLGGAKAFNGPPCTDV